MRFSTVAFLLLFVGLFGGLHRARSSQFARHAAEAHTSRAQEQGSWARSLQEELARTERRYRELKSSESGVERSLRQLQDLVRKGEVEVRRSADRSSREVRQQNQAQMNQDLLEVRAGYEQLLAEIEQLDARRSSLRARLELAKAGIQEPATGVAESPRVAPPEASRPSPLEAIGEATRIVFH